MMRRVMWRRPPSLIRRRMTRIVATSSSSSSLSPSLPPLSSSSSSSIVVRSFGSSSDRDNGSGDNGDDPGEMREMMRKLQQLQRQGSVGGPGGGNMPQDMMMKLLANEGVPPDADPAYEVKREDPMDPEARAQVPSIIDGKAFIDMPQEDRDRITSLVEPMFESRDSKFDYDKVMDEMFTDDVKKDFAKFGMTDEDEMRTMARKFLSSMVQEPGEASRVDRPFLDAQFTSVTNSKGMPGDGAPDAEAIERHDNSTAMGQHLDTVEYSAEVRSLQLKNQKMFREMVGKGGPDVPADGEEVDHERLEGETESEAKKAGTPLKHEEADRLWPLFFDEGLEANVKKRPDKTFKKYRRYLQAMDIQDALSRKSLNLRALLARQLLKHLYGLKTTRILKLYWKRARTHKGGNQMDFFVAQLERRLVMGLVRMRLAPNVEIARRMIKKRMVLVNDVTNIFVEYPLREGDRVSIDYHRAHRLPGVHEYVKRLSGTAFEEYRDDNPSMADPLSHADAHFHVGSEIPHARHVQVDYNILAGVWLYAPGLDDIRLPRNTSYGRHHEGARRLFQIVFSRLKFGP